MVLPSYRAWLCCGVKTAVTGSVEDTLEPAANKSRFQSRYELLVQYLLYRADLVFLVNCFLASQFRIHFTHSCYNRAAINFTYCLTTSFYEFSGWMNTALSLSLLHARSLSLSTWWSVGLFGMELWQEPPHFINAGKGGQKMYQMAPPICSLPFGQVD